MAAQARCRPGRRGLRYPAIGDLTPSRARTGVRPGRPGAGSPYSGTLLIADRGNDRLIALNPTATSPGSTRRPPRRHRPVASTFPTTPSSSGPGPGSSRIKRTTTPSSRSAIRRAGFSGSTVTPASPGSAPGYLDQPDDAYLLKSGIITVADASNNRILFISPAGPGRRPDRQRCRRSRPAHLDRLSQRRHAAGRTATSWYRRSTAHGSTSTRRRASSCGRSTSRLSTTRPIPSSSVRTST